MLYQVARTCTNSRSGALATGQLKYLSCVWQNLSFLDHPHLHPSPTLPPPYNMSSLRTLCLSLDTRRVRVRMFGYAKCSRASQVECLMALFCLNTDLDTTAERRLRICIHSPAAPTCLLLGCAKLPLREHFTLNYIKELRLRFYASLRCDSAFQRYRASRYVIGEVYARRHSMWLHHVNRLDRFEDRYESSRESI